MKMGYFTYYLSFFSILLFSTAFSLHAEMFLMDQLQAFGLYKSFMEAFSEGYIRITLWFVLFLFFFMLFSAVKLIANTVLELSIFFFCENSQGQIQTFPTHPKASTIYLLFSLVSVFCAKSIGLLISLYVLAGLISFALLIYKVGERLNITRMVGVEFLNLMFWAVFLFAVLSVLLKLFNGVVKSIGF